WRVAFVCSSGESGCSAAGSRGDQAVERGMWRAAGGGLQNRSGPRRGRDHVVAHYCNPRQSNLRDAALRIQMSALRPRARVTATDGVSNERALLWLWRTAGADTFVHVDEFRKVLEPQLRAAFEAPGGATGSQGTGQACRALKEDWNTAGRFIR